MVEFEACRCVWVVVCVDRKQRVLILAGVFKIDDTQFYKTCTCYKPLVNKEHR